MPKSKASLLQGTLDMLILKALSLGALHGYGVGQRIAQISGDALKIAEGSLNNQRAKFYKLTRAGRKQLIIERAELGAARGRNDQGAARGLKEDSDYVLDQSHDKVHACLTASRRESS